MTTKEIIVDVARQQGMTPSEVEKEMKEAIREAMASPDPHAQELWRQIAPDGKEPTLDHFLTVVAAMVRKRMGS